MSSAPQGARRRWAGAGVAVALTLAVAIATQLWLRRADAPPAAAAPGPPERAEAPADPAPVGPEPPRVPPEAYDPVNFDVDIRAEHTRREPAEIARQVLEMAQVRFGWVPLGTGRMYPFKAEDRPQHRIVEMSALPADRVSDVEPDYRGDPEHYGSRVVWVVRIAGPVRFQAGPGSAQFESETAFFILEDETGEVLSWGIP